MRGLPARISVVTKRSSWASGRMTDIQFVAGFDDRLVEAGSRLHADNEKIEGIRKPVRDGLLALRRGSLQPEPGKQIAEHGKDSHPGANRLVPNREEEGRDHRERMEGRVPPANT